ncbi:uncharacterized protein JCM6883_000383 [Sporobolomyces salmoneus]|uniref:uncharacterized protein n=1 Tax=Sporobolomyces salmoneus TaxID=183962 RepID=UPI0031820418
MSLGGQQHVSLEPLPIFANDGKDSDLFAKPVRLRDVNLHDGSEAYTRNDPKKSLQERLMRVWAERGDYSLVTEESIRNPPPEDSDKDKVEQDPSGRPSSEEMRKFAESMLNNLTIARGELSTALDLLNVISPATDPPNVDVNTIPLPHETLTLVSTAVLPPPSFTDPTQNPLAALPLAESLESIKLNAKAFFQASEDLIPLDEEEQGDAAVTQSENNESSPSTSTNRKRLSTRAPDPWPTILSLHSSSPSRSLIPLGALPGATLTGKNETRSARQVGVFYGFQEAAPQFRRASVARIGELVSSDVERGGGRKLCVELCEMGGERRVERDVWGDTEGEDKEGDDGGVEGILKRRNRSAFAEELFAKLVNEAKTDSNLGAQYKVGNLTRGDSIELKPIGGWQLRLSMISPTSKLASTSNASPSPSSTPISLISPLLRLLFLQEYSSRRQRPGSRNDNARVRPLLSTISTFLQYLDRIESLKSILGRTKAEATARESEKSKDIEVEIDLWSGEKRLSLSSSTATEEGGETKSGSMRELSQDVLKVVKGQDTELGGRALIKVNKKYAFHILFSLPLPTSSSSDSSSSTNLPPLTRQSLLTLRSPGKSQPVSIPSMRHLEDFLQGELQRIL